MVPSNHLILWCPLLFLPSIFASIRVFQRVESLHQVAKVLELHASASILSDDYLGFISFRIDWFDFPAVQGTLYSLLQHQISKASILQCSHFFMVQFSHLYMTTGKTIGLTIWIFVGKVMSLLFQALSRFCHNFYSKEQVFFNFLLQNIWL